MRPTERIDNFLNKVDWGVLSDRWNLSATDFCNLDKEIWGTKIKDYWKSNPDQRIGQVLINLGIIPDNPKRWNDEESDILEDQGLAPEEYLFWGRNYDKDMNLLDHTEYILVKDLTSDHINAIFDHMFKCSRPLNSLYMKAFINVLKSRKESTGHVEAIEAMWLKEKELKLDGVNHDTTEQKTI